VDKREAQVVTFLHCHFLNYFSQVVTFGSAKWVRLPLPKTTQEPVESEKVVFLD